MIKTPPGFRASLEPVPGLPIRTFAFRGTDLLVRESDHAVPEAAEVEPLVEDPSRLIPVGAHGGIYYQSTWLAGDAAPPGGFKFTGLRRLFGHADDTTLALGGRAFQLADWARSHRFCGACGSPAARVPGERAMRCACGHTAYPRISPAMMVLVRRGPAILLARNAAVPAGGRMSALAGFLEAGESIEEAVHREVHEEVGLEVKDLRYFASQSWPFPNSLMIAFTAEYAGGEIRCAVDEIAEARWFGPGDPLPELPPHESVSRALIDAHRPR